METTVLFDDDRNLFESVSSEANLREAFQAVKRNKGAPGVDKVTIEAFEGRLDAELAQLAKDLREWRYVPQPVRRVEIPKADGKSMRQLGIPCVRDRVVQACLKEVLEPIFEPTFSQQSYGFRPGRNQAQAVEAARVTVCQGKRWVVDIDLSRFFDTISHDRLIHRLSLRIRDKRILRLIGLILRGGVLDKGTLLPTREGSIQGSPLSPLLSNVVLDELDKELEKRGLSFCRWADDANIFVRSKAAALRVMDSVTRFIERHLRLKVNPEKSRVAQAREVRFLGMTIIGRNVAISKKSWSNAMKTVKALTPTNSPEAVEQTLLRVNEWYMGWAQYHAMTYYPFQLEWLEAHVRRRLRSRLIRQCKRRRNLFRRLQKLGIKRKTAAKAVWTNAGPWRQSGEATIEKAWSNAWFVRVGGQKIFSDRKLPHWKSVRSTIMLP